MVLEEKEGMGVSGKKEIELVKMWWRWLLPIFATADAVFPHLRQII